jgi:hypothetical protein
MALAYIEHSNVFTNDVFGRFINHMPYWSKNLREEGGSSGGTYDELVRLGLKDFNTTIWFSEVKFTPRVSWSNEVTNPLEQCHFG